MRLTSLSYQKWVKWESERAIINALNDGDKSFSELVHLTDLSKPVLSQRLKELTRRGKITNVPDMKSKRFLYHLNLRSLNVTDRRFIKAHVLSKIFTLYAISQAGDSSISDEEYYKKLTKIIYVLLDFRMKTYMAAPRAMQKEWLKTTMGLEFANNISKLFPENREFQEHLMKGLPPEEEKILKARNLKERKKRIDEYLDLLLKSFLGKK